MRELQSAFQDERGTIHAKKSAAIGSDFKLKRERMSGKWIGNYSYAEKFSDIARKLPAFLTEIAELIQLIADFEAAIAEEKLSEQQGQTQDDIPDFEE